MLPQKNKKTERQFTQLTLPEQIYKFGGSSLANAKCYLKVARIIRRQLKANDLVVVSASGQTTDWLYALLKTAQSNAGEQQVQCAELVQTIRLHHKAIIDSCLHDEWHSRLSKIISNDIQWLCRLSELGQLPEFHKEIIAFGELWSAQILCAILEQANFASSWIDARKCLKVIFEDRVQTVDQQSSQKYLYEHLKTRQGRTSIVTGFIASDCEGRTELLGRNGSDLTATLLAQLTDAKKVVIWTDVAGVYNFDPNLSADAEPLSQLNIQLIQQLSDLGSPVLHPKTLQPILEKKCQLLIRSTFSPELEGTKVCQSNQLQKNTIVTHKNGLTRFLITAENQIFSQKLLNDFNQWSKALVGEFVLINRLTETTFQLIIDSNHVHQCAQQITLHHKLIHRFSQQPVSLLALVSESTKNSCYQQHFFESFLAKQSLTPVTREQSSITHSSEPSDDRILILREESAFIAFLPEDNIDSIAQDCFEQWIQFKNRQAVFLLGHGNVGQQWLKQIKHLPTTKNTFSVVMTANSKSISLHHAESVFQQIANNNHALVALIEHAPFTDKIVIDATASQEITEIYPQLLSLGIHLISANKLASSSASFHQLQKIAREKNVLWQQNATIGAGLPVNHAISDLLDCGDQVTEIRGVFSGTLSWLLNTYDGSRPLSELIREAQALGYSEPDPRLDLSGSDVARKLVIAGRLAGIAVELAQIQLQPLLAEEFLSGTLEQFWDKAEQFDRVFFQQWQQARADNKKLVYQAVINQSGRYQCGLFAVAADDPLAQISPCDNIFVLKTRWYCDNPLIIRGPGAGKEVTAAAIQSDLNHILARLA